MNAAQTEAELLAREQCVQRGQPFGGEAWTGKATKQLGLEHTFRPRGRPKKEAETKR